MPRTCVLVLLTLVGCLAQTEVSPQTSGSIASTASTQFTTTTLPQKLGDACRSTSQCNETLGELFECSDGTCLCRDDAVTVGDLCFLKKALNETCTRNEECHHIGNASCSVVCVCDQSFEAKGGVCQVPMKVGATAKPANTITPNFDNGLTYKVLHLKTDLVLQCDVSGGNYTLTWLKDGQPVPKNDRIEHKVKENKLIVRKALEEDAGNYTCRVKLHTSTGAPTVLEEIIPVIVKPSVWLLASHTVIEGEKLRLECSVIGRPFPIIGWQIGNETYEKSRDRVELLEDDKKKVPNSVFLIKEARMEDRGVYTCMILRNEFTNSTASTTVRIKDKLAALWPFLGIVAEVFVLCAIILIYEKKRNKAELEESDTDQSPEQKNTPDHAKESVRQRK